ncbi:hypothetical protein BO70DRAFT_402925, partial [Aspergillus heteromorphus CBS 117.55]
PNSPIRFNTLLPHNLSYRLQSTSPSLLCFLPTNSTTIPTTTTTTTRRRRRRRRRRNNRHGNNLRPKPQLPLPPSYRPPHHPRPILIHAIRGNKQHPVPLGWVWVWVGDVDPGGGDGGGRWCWCWCLLFRHGDGDGDEDGEKQELTGMMYHCVR